jgi:ABC-2 type transport system permease protein
MKTILFFIKKEFLQFRRDPKMFAMILIAPVIQLIFLGYAANMDVEKVRTVFYDMDKTVTSRNYIESFTSSRYFQVQTNVSNYSDIISLIDKAKVIMAVIIPKDFEKKLARHETSQVQMIFDGSDGNTASISAGYAQTISNSFSASVISDFRDAAGRKLAVSGSITAEPRVWYNPELKTRTFMVPGIAALLLMVITLILTSLAVVKEKEIGTLEQLIVTPIKPYQMIIGKLVPFTILGFVSVFIVLTAMQLIFNIPVRGSYVFLIFSIFLYVLSTLGLGLFVSTVTKTQQQAMMIAIFGIMMPMIFLSGFTFPIENMPVAIQYVTYLIPMRYIIEIIRGVILKGIGFNDLWPQVLMLFIMGLLILFLSSLRFRKKLD